MKSKALGYGFDIDMTFLRAVRVLYWRILKGESWREIAYSWNKNYPEWEGKDPGGNQLYGMTVVDCAAIKLGLKGHSHRLLY